MKAIVMPQKQKKLTRFGEYLAARSVNKSDVCRKVGISLTRLNRLCYDERSFLRAYELQLIALSINVDPSQMLKDLFGDFKLKEDVSPSEKIIARIAEVLTTKGLIEKYGLVLREIERIAMALPFCSTQKTGDEIGKHLKLTRKSPKFQSALKAAVEAGWLTLQQKREEGGVINMYTITDGGNSIITIVDE